MSETITELPYIRAITDSEKAEIQAQFELDTIDFSLFSGIIYHDYWADYEECGGLAIFLGIDDSIQKLEYGYSVMQEGPTRLYIVELTRTEAIEDINQMVGAILNARRMI